MANEPYLLVAHFFKTLLIVGGDILVMPLLDMIWYATGFQDGVVLGLSQAPFRTCHPVHFLECLGSFAYMLRLMKKLCHELRVSELAR